MLFCFGHLKLYSWSFLVLLYNTWTYFRLKMTLCSWKWQLMALLINSLILGSSILFSLLQKIMNWFRGFNVNQWNDKEIYNFGQCCYLPEQRNIKYSWHDPYRNNEPNFSKQRNQILYGSFFYWKIEYKRSSVSYLGFLVIMKIVKR